MFDQDEGFAAGLADSTIQIWIPSKTLPGNHQYWSNNVPKYLQISGTCEVSFQCVAVLYSIYRFSIRSICQLRDGRLISGNHCRNVQIWNVFNPKEVITCSTIWLHGDWVNVIIPLPSHLGLGIVSSGADRALCITTLDKEGMQINNAFITQGLSRGIQYLLPKISTDNCGYMSGLDRNTDNPNFASTDI